MNIFKKLFYRIISKFIKSVKYSLGVSHFLNMRNKYKKIKNINDLDYKIYSQNGEDGIIDYLLHSLKIYKPKFIEIGVGDYTECNSRFFFERTSPKGLIIDCIKNFKLKVKKNIKLWKGDLTIIEKFVNSENIIEILKEKNFLNNLDFFSLDVDGVDYWILKKFPKNFSKICVIEFNSNFGPDKEITVPNIKNFDRTKYHYSNLCYGASLKALVKLMEKKNFVFVGTNLDRVNAFFVSKKYIKMINLRIPKKKNLKTFTYSNLRESRDKKNNLNYLSGNNKLKIIKNCKVIDLSKKKNKISLLKDLFN
jgi:hypothetical protein